MTDREQELFELYDSLPRSTLAMYLARDRLRIEKLEAELSRERRRVNQLRRAVLAWASARARVNAQAEYALSDDYDEHVALRMWDAAKALWARARDRSHDDE